MKIRVFEESNYFAIQDDEYNIYRYKIDLNKPITKLQYPDVVDISLGNHCTGSCSYCYASANAKKHNYDRVIDKLNTWLSGMTINQRPFQIALGGGGEPTLHYKFNDVVKLISHYGVVPTYTTAGFAITDDIIQLTKEYCGGVAVTAHRHINWIDTVERFLANDIRTNIHVIIGGSYKSVDYARMIRERFSNVNTVVLLPYVPMGYGSYIMPDKSELIDGLVLGTEPGYAIGAMYSKYLERWPSLFDPYSMFDETFFSGYLELTTPPIMYKSSFIRELRNDI